MREVECLFCPIFIACYPILPLLIPCSTTVRTSPILASYPCKIKKYPGKSPKPKATGARRIHETRRNIRTRGNISRSALEREIDGKYDKKPARRQKLSINETDVQSTFALISNVAQCIFYDYYICYGQTYIQPSGRYTKCTINRYIFLLNAIILSVSPNP